MIGLKNIKDGRLYIAIIIITVLGATLYANSISGKFIWDDNMLVKNNAHIKNLSNIPRMFAEDMGEGAGERTGFYRPIQVASYALDYSIWGLDETGYHVTNILLHISVALCIFWLVNILFSDKLVAFLASLFFIIQPVHAEAVSYISGRADLLAGLFILLSLIYYIKNARDDSAYSYILTISLYMLALLSKEISLMLPLLLILCHIIFKERLRIKTSLSVLSLSIIYIILRFGVLKVALVAAGQETTLSQRIPGVFAALASYLRLIILPFNLHMDYGVKIFNWLDPIVVLGASFFLLAIALVVKSWKSDKLLVFSLFWFILWLSPQSNIYPLTAYMAEHWLYLPSIGLLLILARYLAYLYRGSSLKYPGFFIISGIVIFYSALTINQNNYWNEPISFYERTLRFAPYSTGVYNNLGVSYNSIGDRERAVELFKKAIDLDPERESAYFNLGNVYKEISEDRKAIDAYKKAIEIRPDYAMAYNNMGFVYGLMGEDEEAVESFRKAIEISPNRAHAYHNLANTYRKIGDLDEAINQYQRTIEIDAERTGAYRSLIEIYQEEKKYDKAVLICERLIRIDRTDPKLYNNLGSLYGAAGRYRDAIAVYERAIALDPVYVKAYNNLGVMYAKIGSHQKALDILDKALMLDPGHAETHNNIAVAYHETGRYDLSIAHCDRAIELGFSPDPEFLDKLKEYR
jgi:tetratricopeptide (TPR) repeat protein